ncbi:hypothetical protein CMQ_7065 [Grosmannia clavigera kw1407]|uniref:Extracellular membrane protein CFEM domain-containing protein n=1 Tax=Grosmannia clavigera (strain kw1407 / UAMH 11150) TaxID=655863 RepID=F0XPJ6_GROCL|nr:uncharacterized protein CMQ_7065 [Grosmannia clavigera kw1407]EFX00063.1 hypothetical protein CMQ_7065 [Grosmannia clavigera kw1407]
MACWSASRQRVVIAAWLVLQGFTKPVRGITNDFSAYPTNSQACIYLASSQGKCNSASSVTGLNECLCTNNSGFITKAAACVGQQDPSDLGEVYTVMSDACAYTNIDIALSRSEFLSAAAAASSSSSSASSTSATSSSSASSTSTTSSITRSSTLSKSTTSSSVGSTATNSANASGTNTTSSQPTETSGASASTDDSLGISSTAKIGIISGACVAGVTIMSAAALFIFRYRRNRRPAEESAPMLSLAGFAGGSSNAGVGGGGSGGSGNGGNGGSGGSGGVGFVEIPGISEVPGSIGHSELPGGHTYWKAAEGVGANAKWHQAAGMNQIPHQQQEIFELPAHQDSSPYAEMPAREEPTPYAELSAQRHSTSPWVEMPASSVEDGVPMSTIVTPVSAKSEEGNSYAGTSYANSVVYEDLKEDWPAPAYRP